VDLRDYVRVLRRRWRLIALAVLASVGASAVVTLSTTPTYQSHAKLFVSTQVGTDNASGVYQGGLLAQQRVKSYVDLVQGQRVAERVVERLALPMTAVALRRKVDASSPLDTVLLKITVTDASPAQAQRIADATAAAFTEFVTEIEKPTGGGTPPVKVSVVEQAQIAETPVAPRAKLNLALGLLVGLAIGAGGAVLRETFDTRLKDTSDLFEASGAALLGVIGADPDVTRRPLVVQVEPQSHLAEAYRHLRTSIQFIAVDRRIRSFVITSAVAGEGKSTVSANLSIAIAQLGQRVLLVETDLRRPTLSGLLGIEGAVGLTDVLIGRATLADAMQTWGQGSLSVLPAGTSPPNPSELLASQAMAELISELESQADIVVFDAPPLLPVTDAAILATRTSGAVIIARAGSTTREEVARAVETLGSVGAPLLGSVLTVAPIKGPNAAYYYAYASEAAAWPDPHTTAPPKPLRPPVGRRSAGFPVAPSVDEPAAQPEPAEVTVANGHAPSTDAAIERTVATIRAEAAAQGLTPEETRS